MQSSRRLEREAGRNVEVVWLTGRLVPDHKTIADFRKDSGCAIRKVCARYIALCRAMGLLSVSSVTIDGSKFKAVNNRDRNFTRAKMEWRRAPRDTCRDGARKPAPRRAAGASQGRRSLAGLDLGELCDNLAQPTKAVGFASAVQLLASETGLPWKVTAWPEVICDPFMVHSASAPSLLRHRMSEVPVPVKSPICAICQEELGITGLP